MIDLEDQLPPHVTELEHQLFAVYFNKPYEVDRAITFMKIHGYSLANMVITENIIIFYQRSIDVPKSTYWFTPHVLEESVIYEDLQVKKIPMNLRFKSYFTGKVVFITVLPV